jgi:hypothetical protein
MRGFLIKSLRTEFEKGLKQRMPSVKRVPLHPGSAASTGSRAWLVGENENATGYIILLIHHQMDEFTIELAWSRKKQLPQRQDWEPGQPGRTDESRFRFSRLWRPDGSEVWYDLTHELDIPDVIKIDPFPDPSAFLDEQACLERIPMKVKRALNALEEHGIPYLKRVVGLPRE